MATRTKRTKRAAGPKRQAMSAAQRKAASAKSAPNQQRSVRPLPSPEAGSGPTLDSRVLGCLLGGAVGDALGAPVEFLSLSEIRARFGPAGIQELAPAYGRVGAITDDTQMTLFTAEGLLRAEVRYCGRGICHPPSVVHHAYLRWLRTQGERGNAEISQRDGWPDGWLVAERALWSRRAPGNTCVEALRGVRELGELPRNQSKGCGTVMRVAPVGIVCASPFEVGVEVSRLTHGHPSGYYAGGFFAELVGLLVEGRALRESIEFARQRLTEHPEARGVLEAVDRAIARAEEVPPTPEALEALGGGWTADEAVAISLFVAVTAADFESALRLAVNHGGDSDSTGALVGNLLGAMRGVEAIPVRWLEQLELRSVIEQVSQDLFRLASGTFDAELEAARYPGW